MGDVSGRDARGSYRVYTRRFDRVVEAKYLDLVLGPIPLKYKLAYDEACQEFDHGLAGWRTKLETASIPWARSIADRLDSAARGDTVVSLLIDHSGSMKGQRLLLAAATATCVADALGSLGIKVEVLGFTTRSWRGGRPRLLWRFWRRQKPGRLCELLHVIYRAPDDRTPGMPWAIRRMLRADLPKENVDGEAVEWAANRLMERPESRKLLVVMTDGAPVDDSTLVANGAEYLSDHLRRIVTEIERNAHIAIGAVDICSGHAKAFYSRGVLVEVVDEIGIKTQELILRLLSEAPVVSQTVAAPLHNSISVHDPGPRLGTWQRCLLRITRLLDGGSSGQGSRQ